MEVLPSDTGQQYGVQAGIEFAPLWSVTSSDLGNSTFLMRMVHKDFLCIGLEFHDNQLNWL